MIKYRNDNPSDYIVPVNMNNLQGRMLRYTESNQSNKEILLVYGHHTSIERCWELVKVFGKYGAVTVPDFPGFGGMESLHKIKEFPNIDNLADYLAAFFKLRYKQRRVTIVAIGFGFLITTRMLQKYPDIVKKIDLCVGINAFSHGEDIVIGRLRKYWYLLATNTLNIRFASVLFKVLWLKIFLPRVNNQHILNSTHHFTFRGDSFYEPANVDYKLWSVNEIRTHAQAIRTMLTIDNCRDRINLPLWHITFKNQTFFNDNYVEQHLKVIYSEYHKLNSKFKLDLPLGSPYSKVNVIIPAKLRQKLSKLSNS